MRIRRPTEKLFPAPLCQIQQRRQFGPQLEGVDGFNENQRQANKNDHARSLVLFVVLMGVFLRRLFQSFLYRKPNDPEEKAHYCQKNAEGCCNNPRTNPGPI